MDIFKMSKIRNPKIILKKHSQKWPCDQNALKTVQPKSQCVTNSFLHILLRAFSRFPKWNKMETLFYAKKRAKWACHGRRCMHLLNHNRPLQ